MAEQLCALGYADLEGLSLRLQESAEDIRNPSFRDDIMQASRAVSDLASIKFGIEEIAGDCRDRTAAKELYELLGKKGRP